MPSKFIAASILSIITVESSANTLPTKSPVLLTSIVTKPFCISDAVKYPELLNNLLTLSPGCIAVAANAPCPDEATSVMPYPAIVVGLPVKSPNATVDKYPESLVNILMLFPGTKKFKLLVN